MPNDSTSSASTLLRQTSLFKDVTEAALQELGTMSSVVAVPADTVLSVQGETPNALYVVLDGQVALETTPATGQSAVVQIKMPGGFFVLSAVLSAMPAQVTARAVGTARLLKIDAARLRQLLATEASVANSLLQATAHDFGAMVQQVCDLKLRTTAQRLGCYLLSLTETTGNDRAAFKLPFDKRLLAARLGCRQENLSRAFASLRQMGVETHGARVILHDIPKLRDYSEPDELLTFSRS